MSTMEWFSLQADRFNPERDEHLYLFDSWENYRRRRSIHFLVSERNNVKRAYLLQRSAIFEFYNAFARWRTAVRGWHNGRRWCSHCSNSFPKREKKHSPLEDRETDPSQALDDAARRCSTTSVLDRRNASDRRGHGTVRGARYQPIDRERHHGDEDKRRCEHLHSDHPWYKSS